MGFSELIRSFLGLNTSISGSENAFRNPIWNIDDDDDDDMEDELYHEFGGRKDMFSGESFNVFSDPLEMARYAEHQMDRMLSMFNSMLHQEFGHNIPLPPNVPVIPLNPPGERHGERNIRDEYLKPGYSKPLHDKCMDSDLDKEISEKNLDSVLESISKLQKHGINTEDDKKVEIISPGANRMFFKQVITRSVLHPDGRMETTRTVRNEDGTQETTNIVTEANENNQYNNLNDTNIISPNGNIWSTMFGLSF